MIRSFSKIEFPAAIRLKCESAGGPKKKSSRVAQRLPGA